MKPEKNSANTINAIQRIEAPHCPEERTSRIADRYGLSPNACNVIALSVDNPWYIITAVTPLPAKAKISLQQRGIAGTFLFGTCPFGKQSGKQFIIAYYPQ